ncbi:MAG: hypothetical protein JW867_03870 [Candidatus Omnitrophica bacterium]|nr:hypothetical protein [Candidatus Omnitrophota bacterium]
MSKKLSLLLILTIFFFFAAIFDFYCFADKVVLHSGEVIEGKIVEETGAYIRIKDPAGFLKKYSLSEVESISSGSEAKPLSTQTLEEPQASINHARKSHEISGQQTNNLINTEAMLKDTIKQLYPADAYNDQLSPEDKGRIANNLIRTEAMIKDTIKQLYPVDASKEGFKEDEAPEINSLKKERDKKYQNYKKYY